MDNLIAFLLVITYWNKFRVLVKDRLSDYFFVSLALYLIIATVLIEGRMFCLAVD